MAAPQPAYEWGKQLGAGGSRCAAGKGVNVIVTTAWGELMNEALMNIHPLKY